MITFKRTDAEHQQFKDLVALLDAELNVINGKDQSFYAQYNKIDMIRHAIVCFENGIAVGCGAFKPFDDDSVEIKRMFVQPEVRGKGIGRMIVNELEKWAAGLNYKYCILETGKRQPYAIKLYENAGYVRISNYGQYKDVDNSVCMKKAIGLVT
jgi:putative acetyltransferase